MSNIKSITFIVAFIWNSFGKILSHNGLKWKMKSFIKGLNSDSEDEVWKQLPLNMFSLFNGLMILNIDLNYKWFDANQWILSAKCHSLDSIESFDWNVN